MRETAENKRSLDGRQDADENVSWRKTATYTAIGAAIGLVTSLILRASGSTCPLTCNPYVATPLAAFIGFLWSRGEYP